MLTPTDLRLRESFGLSLNKTLRSRLSKLSLPILPPHPPLQLHASPISSMALECTVQERLLTADVSGTVSLIQTNGFSDSMETLPVLFTISAHDRRISSVIWYPFDDGMFSTASHDGIVKVWDTQYAQIAAEFPLSTRVNAHAMSSIATTHSFIAVGCDDPTFRLLDLQSGSAAHSLIGHSGPIRFVSFSPRDPFCVISASEDGTIRFWDVRNGRTSQMLETEGDAIQGGCLSHCGGWMWICGRKKWWVWRQGALQSVSYGKVSKTLACSSMTEWPILYVGRRNCVDIYDDAGNFQRSIHGHFGTINTLVCNTLQNELYSGGADGQLIIYRPDRDEKERLKSDPIQIILNTDQWSDDDS